jgi:hypothetical protein
MGYFGMNLFFLRLKNIFGEFQSSEKGVTTIEYGIIAIAVSVMIIAVFYTFPSLVSTIRNDLIAVATIVMGQTFQ